MTLAQPFHIIAHRGASAYAPENTMAAFRKAADMGAPEVETDVCFTRDEKVLLFHDRTLDRTTDGNGSPADYTLAELKELDAGSWLDAEKNPDFEWAANYAGERLITLDELLSEFGETFTYHVEIKAGTEGLVDATIGSIRQHGLIDHVFIAAIDDEASLARAKQVEPEIRTALALTRLLRERGPRAVAAAREAGHQMINLNASNQSAELVDLGHDLGLEVRSSGIRNRDDMAEAVRIGCNGMTINWPDWLIDCVAEHELT